MFILKDKEMLASIGRKGECHFYPRRIDPRCKPETMSKLWHDDMIFQLPADSICVFFVKGVPQVRLMTSMQEFYRFETLSEAASKPYLELEWITGL